MSLKSEKKSASIGLTLMPLGHSLLSLGNLKKKTHFHSFRRPSDYNFTDL